MARPSPFHGLATRMGLGSVARRFWHEPRGRLKQMVLEGGPLEQHRTARGHEAMKAAATRLPQMTPPDGRYGVEARFLSGANFWYQTVFCIASLQRHADKRIDPVIVDDGTLSGAVREAILAVVPWARFVLGEEVAEQLETRLPRSRFPALRARREVYPHLRKLTDLHDPGAWSLILDSDMLFFRRPDALLAWMDAPADVLFIEDVVRSYGYSDALMDDLARGSVPARMNVGLYGLHGAAVDFDYLERCCRVTIDRERANYVQEQALTALLVSGMTWKILPAAEYRVMPDIAEGRAPTAVMHHYVAQSKRSYFQYGWKQTAANLSAHGLVSS